MNPVVFTTRFAPVPPGIFVNVPPLPPSVCHMKVIGAEPPAAPLKVTLVPANTAMSAVEGDSSGGLAIGAAGRDMPRSNVMSYVFGSVAYLTLPPALGARQTWPPE